MAESFADLTLADPLLAAVEEIGLRAPSAIQSRLVAAVLAGSDVVAITPTGQGGTTGYLLGLMQRLLAEPAPEGRGPRALVLAPTRDQAMQIGRMIKQFGHDTRLRFGTVVGGRPYPTQHQLLRRPLDILVATPGRLMDHIRRGRVPFERLRLLVLDKTDQMLDMGLGSEIYSIVDASAETLQQKVVLSDAPNDAVGLLVARLTRYPVRIDEGAGEAVSEKLLAETATVHEEVAEIMDEDEDERQPAELQAGTMSESSRSGARRSKPRGPRRAGAGNAGGTQGGKPAGKSVRGPRAARQGGGNKPAQANGGNGGGNGKTGKGGLRGPGRRLAGAQGQGGRGRRSPDVRFPSDYASGPGGASKAPPAEPRGPQPNEPVQYSADYGFSVAPGARKPVNVVYRTKGRRRREDGGEDEKG